MIEGGGLGVFAPEDVGPVSVQVPNGVVDVLCDRREGGRRGRPAATCRTSRATCATGPAPTRQLLRDVVPPDRRRVYDVRRALELLADEGSVLELRPAFAPGMVTALARIEGRPVGVLANNPQHLAGAIDADNADKAARFMQLCEAFGLPLLSLCDTPGFMVGPRGGGDRAGPPRQPHVRRRRIAHRAVRHAWCCARATASAPRRWPGEASTEPLFTVAWPTGELGGMGLEGAVRLGFRRELEAIEDPGEREAAFAAMVFRAYEHGKALHVAEYFEIDDVIDPADTRARIVHALDRPARARTGPIRTSTGRAARPFVDTW